MTESQFNLELQGYDTAVALSILEEKKASERVADISYRRALFIQNTMADMAKPLVGQPSETETPAKTVS